jgi:predicted transcriptional regulator of viral defense system
MRDIGYPQSNNSRETRVGGLTMSKHGGISPAGRAELTRILSPGRRFVTTAEVAAALDVDPDTAAKKLSRWAAEGWLRRARRGLYIRVPVDASNPATWSEDALIVAAVVWSPCYFTGWTAANHWALTDQVFRTTVLKTTKRVRASDVRLLDHAYHVTHVLPERLDWGMRTEWRGEVKLRIADPARTVIDILDSPGLGGGIRHAAEILASYLDDHDPSTLIDYGDRLGNRAVFKRLGYAVEVVSPGHASLIEACRARLSAGISPLDPGGPPGGHRMPGWGLRVNVRLVPEEPA